MFPKRIVQSRAKLAERVCKSEESRVTSKEGTIGILTTGHLFPKGEGRILSAGEGLRVAELKGI